MKDDQVVRAVAAVCLVGIYTAHKGLNGTGPVEVPWMGTVAPIVLVTGSLLVLAFPELIDRFPMGPTRK